MRYELLGDRLLVKVLEANERTDGGLYIPAIAIDGTPWMRAQVRAVGTGRLMQSGAIVPLQVRPDDVIIFWRSSTPGEQLVFPGDDGEELLCIREQNVLTILRDLEKVSSLQGLDGKRLVMQ